MKDTSGDVTAEEIAAMVDLMLLVDPGVKAVLDEHLEFYRELLSFVFFGALARWSLGEGKSPAVVEAMNCLYVLGSSQPQNIVEVGFCEGVPIDVTDEQIDSVPEPLRSRIRLDLGR